MKRFISAALVLTLCLTSFGSFNAQEIKKVNTLESIGIIENSNDVTHKDNEYDLLFRKLEEIQGQNEELATQVSALQKKIKSETGAKGFFKHLGRALAGTLIAVGTLVVCVWGFSKTKTYKKKVKPVVNNTCEILKYTNAYLREDGDNLKNSINCINEYLSGEQSKRDAGRPNLFGSIEYINQYIRDNGENLYTVTREITNALNQDGNVIDNVNLLVMLLNGRRAN